MVASPATPRRHGLRGDTSNEDRAYFDNYYIKNWSPWLDVRIVIKTGSQALWGSPRLTDTLIADLRVPRRGCLHVGFEEEEELHPGLSP